MRFRTILASILVATAALSAAPANAASPSVMGTAQAIANELNKKMSTFASPADPDLAVTMLTSQLPANMVTRYTVKTQNDSLAGWSVAAAGKVACVVMGLNGRYIATNDSCLGWYAKNRSKILAKSSLTVMDEVMVAVSRQIAAEAAVTATKPTIAAAVAALPAIGGSNLFKVTATKTSLKLTSSYASATYRLKNGTLTR